jgi:hypothetical protein
MYYLFYLLPKDVIVISVNICKESENHQKQLEYKLLKSSKIRADWVLDRNQKQTGDTA